MALPSPCFVQNAPKPVVAEKTHVTRSEVMKETHFIAYCKVCREGFSSENELFQHRKTHEKCPYDDCKFNANEKVIADHVQRVHMKSNTLVKIQDLTTPEQIEKWREERRKRYPTSSNVLLRQQAKEARVERGEKLQDRQQRFGDNKQRNHIKNFDNKRNNQNHFRQDRGGDRGHDNQRHPNNRRDRQWKPREDNKEREQIEQPKESKVDALLDTEASAQISTDSTKSFINEVKVVPSIPSKYIQPRVEKQHIDESSDDENKATPRFKGTAMMKDYHEVKTIVQEKAALSILGMYGSDSDSEDEATKTVLSNDPVISVVEEMMECENVINKQELIIEDSPMPEGELEMEAPDEVPIQHNAEENPLEPSTSIEPEKLSRKRRQEHERSQRYVRPKPRNGLDYSKLRTMSSANPFLEKLLQQDIRHERNVLLQCVNYVVKNNFFEAPLKTEESSTLPEVTEEASVIETQDSLETL